MKPWILCAFSLGVAFGQQPAKIVFEVASIRPSKPPSGGRMRIGMNVDGAMLRYSNANLKDCIRTAFRVKEFQVQGPEWLSAARFDIVAKLPDGSSKEQVPEMLQSLLAERFKLALHRDTKEHAVYALVAAKGGPKLKPAEVTAGAAPKPGGDPARGPMPRGAMAMMMSPSGMHLRSSATTLANFAEAISRFCERPVVDATGIQGLYDFDLVFSPETLRNMPGGGPMMMRRGGGERPQADAPSEPAVSIYEAVQRYGLKLEPRKAPMEMLVIDHIEKEPTAN